MSDIKSSSIINFAVGDNEVKNYMNMKVQKCIGYFGTLSPTMSNIFWKGALERPYIIIIIFVRK